MSRLGKSFQGGDPFVRGRHRAPYLISDRRVTLAEYRRQWRIVFGDSRAGAHPLPRQQSARGRKRSIDARLQRVGCHHDFDYHEDHEDYGCYGSRTQRWLECVHCHECRRASWNDAPQYD